MVRPAPVQTTPCMIDNTGRRVEAWLPHMQSSDFLRAAISRGERTAESWAELTIRARRCEAGAEAIAWAKAEDWSPRQTMIFILTVCGGFWIGYLALAWQVTR